MSNGDKAEAGLPYRGEARRLRIRQPRFDRDGLFLFGRRHASQSLAVSADELEALAGGRWLAVDVFGEYILYIHLEEDAR
jgi:hypothetical protein